MLNMRSLCSCIASAALVTITASPLLAIEVTGAPGSPGATTTIDGKQLPPPDPKFGGGDQGKGHGVEGLVAATCRTA